ncbi:mRNA surveillance protein pelota [Candidatus Woesearchaeota archaeon]|nr:MAG: mRNA surveillance protein pelota [Candidatus Woesearchaeota archaeon]
MKIVKSDWKKGSVTVKPETPDDLWVLSQIAEPGDRARARTMRKVKINSSGSCENATAVVKKPVTLTLEVTKSAFSPETHSLRISGTVIEGPEDVPRGSHHTFSIEKDSVLTLEKQSWLNFQKRKLEDAATGRKKNVLICVHDREEAIIAETTPTSFAILAHLRGNVAKKSLEGTAQKTENFYEEIARNIAEYNERKNPKSIIIASPAFWKEEMGKAIEKLSDESLKKKVVLATCSSVSGNAISEVLKRPETRQALENVRSAEEESAVDELLKRIAKNEPATYGFEHVKSAAEAGAVEKLLVTNSFLIKSREEGTFHDLEDIMRNTESARGEVMIVESEDAMAKLDGIGSLGAILRFPIE